MDKEVNQTEVEWERLDMRKAMAAPPPPFWEFEEDHPTFLQTDKMDGEQRWYLTKEIGDHPKSWVILPEDLAEAARIVVHVASKTWVNRGQVFEAAFPALRELAHRPRR